jgi:outer membrane protein TolC
MANYFPSIVMLAGATHTEGVFVNNPLFPARSQIYSNYTGGFQAQQVLYDFGKTSNRVGANSDLTKAAELDYTSARELVKVNVQVAYFGYLAARKVVAVNEEAVAQTSKHLTQAKAFYSVGRRPQLDVTKAEVDLANAKVNLITATNQLQIAKVQLENAMGVHPTGTYAVSEDITITPFPGTLDSARATAKRLRPELLSARSRLEATRELASSAWSQHLPTISAVGNWNWNGFEPTPLYGRWNAGLQISLPIFQGFAISAQVDQAEANADASQAALDTETESVLLEVDQSYLTLREAEERKVATAKLVEQAEENLKLAERQYAAGVGTSLDITDAQLTRSNAQITNIQAIYDYITSLVRLRRAMGIVTE